MNVEVVQFWVGINLPNLDMETEEQQVQALNCIQEARSWFREFCLEHCMFPDTMTPGPEPFDEDKMEYPIAMVFNGFRSTAVPFPLDVLQEKEFQLEKMNSYWRIACADMEEEPSSLSLEGDWTYDSVIEDMKKDSSVK